MSSISQQSKNLLNPDSNAPNTVVLVVVVAAAIPVSVPAVGAVIYARMLFLRRNDVDTLNKNQLCRSSKYDQNRKKAHSPAANST